MVVGHTWPGFESRLVLFSGQICMHHTESMKGILSCNGVFCQGQDVQERFTWGSRMRVVVAESVHEASSALDG